MQVLYTPVNAFQLQLPHLVAPLIDDYCDDVRVIHKLAEHRGPSEPCDNTKTSSEGFFQPGVGRSTFFDNGVKVNCSKSPALLADEKSHSDSDSDSDSDLRNMQSDKRRLAAEED